MSRLMSVAMTADAVVERRKTVTRRKGWLFLKPGDTLTLCRKVQGRRRCCPGCEFDEPLERLAEVQVVTVNRERLGDLLAEDPWGDDPAPANYARREVAREGFPGMPPEDFVERFFVKAQRMFPDDYVTRIEWRYVCGSGFCECGGCVL